MTREEPVLSIPAAKGPDLGRPGITAPSVPRPEVGLADAAAVLSEHYGLTGDIVEIGSQQDRNFRVDTASGRYVLKFGHPEIDTVDAQLAAMDALRALAEHGIAAPRAVSTTSGQQTVTVTVRGQRLPVRLLSWVDGEPLADGLATRAALPALGRAAGLTCRALADLPVTSTEPTGQWDLRVAAPLALELSHAIDDGDQRAAVEAVTTAAAARLAEVAADLPIQIIHGDLTDDNVTVDAADPGVIIGVIDLGDVGPGWRVAELAVGVAALLHHRQGDPLSVLAMIAAFNDEVPLGDAEIRALWPLVVLRGATLVVAGQYQAKQDADNDYLVSRADREWTSFEVAASITFDEAELAIRAALGAITAPAVTGGDLLAPRTPATLLDYSVYSAELDGGAWLRADTEAALARTVASSGRIAVSRYGEYRATRARPLCPSAPCTLATAVEVTAPGRHLLQAPFDGTVRPVDGGVALAGAGVELYLYSGAEIGAGPVRAGDVLGEIPQDGDGLGRVAIALSAVPGLVPPLHARPGEEAIWAAAAPDPTGLLGLPIEGAAGGDDDASRLLQRRDATFATVHERYYDAPPQIERGWRHFLIDTTGRSYLDMINNVTAVGHGHPRLTAAIAAQWARLNTNSRFLYRELVSYTERLASLAPAGLDVVFLVNSGTEANDLALRLARTATGRRDVVALRESYHGWSTAVDEVSLSLNDNPHALGTRPDWVHVADAPNIVRGRYRGPESGPQYVADLEALLAGMDAAGTPPAAFIAEPIFGNGGGVQYPDGYLAGVYDAVRRRGGICIADEVQVGLGRLGSYFWGFEQQSVMPDIITVAKALGNGHPLGAVITTREIADRFAAQGQFFSSSGGSPVSCVVGNTVLDILADEDLIGNAARTGDRLRSGLLALAGRHPSIGAVHGMGLFLGVEMVSDREAMTPDAALTAAVCDALLGANIIVLPTGDGRNVLKIKPPMTIDGDAVDYFLDRLDWALGRLNR